MRRDVERRRLTDRAALATSVDAAAGLLALVAGVARDTVRLTADGPPPHPYLLHPSPTVTVVVHVLGAVVLAVGRRRRPGVTAVALAALSVVVPLVSALLACYAVARYLPRLRVVAALVALVVAGLLVGGDLLSVVGRADWRSGDPYSLVLLALLLAAAGLYVRARGDLLQSYADRAEREARMAAEAEALRERYRLAVRLHDEVSRELTALTMAAGALGAETSDPATRSDARAMHAAGQRALGTIHGTIRTLTADVEGGGAGGAREAVAPDDTCRDLLERCLLEALRNAARHAPGAPVHVDLDDRGLVVVNGPPAPPGAARGATPGSGRGLHLLRDGVERAGGWMEAGSSEGGGWRVEVRLP